MPANERRPTAKPCLLLQRGCVRQVEGIEVQMRLSERVSGRRADHSSLSWAGRRASSGVRAWYGAMGFNCVDDAGCEEG